MAVPVAAPPAPQPITLGGRSQSFAAIAQTLWFLPVYGHSMVFHWHFNSYCLVTNAPSGPSFHMFMNRLGFHFWEMLVFLFRPVFPGVVYLFLPDLCSLYIP